MGIFDGLFGKSEPTQESCNETAKDLKNLRDQNTLVFNTARQMEEAGMADSMSLAQKNIIRQEKELETTLQECRDNDIEPRAAGGSKPQSQEIKR